MSDFHERKAQRSYYYRNYVHGWRTKPCGACSGSGYYDHNGSPPCASCDGEGVETYRGPKALDVMDIPDTVRVDLLRGFLEVREILEQGRGTLDHDRREAYYQQLDKLWKEMTPEERRLAGY